MTEQEKAVAKVLVDVVQARCQKVVMGRGADEALDHRVVMHVLWVHEVDNK